MEIELDPAAFQVLRTGLKLHVLDSAAVQAVDRPYDADAEIKRGDSVIFDASIQLGDVLIRKMHEPYNVEAEAALLGALMIDNRLVDHVHMLQASHFASELHAEIYSAILAKVGRNEIANPVTLRPLFHGHTMLADVGGPAYLAQLTGSGAAVIGARDFAKQITDLWELRAIRASMHTALERTNGSEDVLAAEIVADLENELSESMVAPVVRTTSTFADAFKDAVGVIEDISHGGEPAGFIIARYTDWNAVAGRMEPGDFILVGGRPSMGKTGVGVTVALGAAENGIGTDLLSLEMDKRKATRRAIAALIYDTNDPLPYQDLIDGKLRRAHWRLIMDAQSAILELPLTISDPPLMAVEDVGPHIRKRQREFERRGQKLQLVVLDYLGRLTTRKKLQGTTEIVSHISRTLKQAAKETGVVLIGLAQLSRALESREDKRPMLADLRDSGSLEQDADTVIFVYREQYYLERSEPPKDKPEKHQAWLDQMGACQDDLQLIASKRREGALTKRVSKFFLKYQAVLDHHDPRVTSGATLFDDNDPGFGG